LFTPHAAPARSPCGSPGVAAVCQVQVHRVAVCITLTLSRVSPTIARGSCSSMASTAGRRSLRCSTSSLTLGPIPAPSRMAVAACTLSAHSACSSRMQASSVPIASGREASSMSRSVAILRPAAALTWLAAPLCARHVRLPVVAQARQGAPVSRTCAVHNLLGSRPRAGSRLWCPCHLPIDAL
jgi:hypothetical protein